jgi:hypothetical protein
MKTYYKKQETIEGIFWTGQGSPTEVFPEDAALTYNNKTKEWKLDDVLMNPGFYNKDGWGKWRWMHPQLFAMTYDEKPYALKKD